MASRSLPARVVPQGTLRPTHTRNWVIVFAVTLAILSMIDRVCIAQAAPLIRRDLGFSLEQMALIFTAFAWGYALFEIPGGFLGDLLGARKVLMRIVLWWSFFTAATGWMWSVASMWIVRFLFGAGEAGCFPNLTKMFSVWLPPDEKVRAQGIMWMSARWGGAVTPLLVIAVLQYVDWRTAFLSFGLIGVIWAVLFYRWYRDNPLDHPSMNQAEKALLTSSVDNAGSHGDVPWATMLRSRSIWLLWVQYFCLSYPWYFYITWLPTYLQEQRGLTQTESGQLAGLPLLFGGFGSLLCGFLLPRVSRRLNSVTRSRRLFASLGFAGAGVFLLTSTRIADPLAAMLVMGMASFFNDLVMPGAWASCMDMGGKYAGTVSGSMNMMGNLAGAVAPFLGAVLVTRYGGDWNVSIYVMGAFYFVGALCWPFIDPVTPLEDKAGAHH